jgi:hypothetical protein
MKRLPLLGIAVMAGLCLNAATAKASITQDDLGPAPDAMHTAYVAMSPDCRNIAMVITNDEESVELRINGKRQATANEIPIVLYSPDGRRLAYTVLKDKTWYIVLDGKETETGSQPADQVAFSADGQHVVYVRSAQKVMQLVVDGIAVGKEYDDIQNIVISPKGDHIAFAASDGPGGQFVILDGKKVGATYPLGIERITVSQDGQRIAFAGVLSRDAGTAWRYEVDIDGKSYGPYHDILSGPTFAPDSKVYYGAARATGAAVPVRGGVEFPLTYHEVIDGEEQRRSEAADQRIWSGDGRHVIDAYQVTAGNGGSVEDLSLDRKHLDAMPYNLTLSPDGHGVASISGFDGNGMRFVRLEGGVRARSYINVGAPLFSPDGAHLAYAAQDKDDGDWFLVSNRRVVDKDTFIVRDEPVELEGALVVPTPDLDASGKWNPITKFEDQKSIDNGSSYPGQLPYHFDPDGTLVYFRIADGHLYRVHWKPDDVTTAPTTKP